MTHIDLSQLSLLKAINKKLVSGYHISEQDRELWQQLDQQIEQYAALFAALGYELVQDARGFVYLYADDATPSMGKTSRSFALTIYILIEHFANQGNDPINALFDQDIDLSLMQSLVQHNKHLFDQLEIFSGSDLRKDVFMRMVRLGVAKATEQGFLLQAPAYRYIDALLEINDFQEMTAEEPA